MKTPDYYLKETLKGLLHFRKSIKYAGPDCGLGAWPFHEIAAQLLSNVAKSMTDFRKGL